MAKEFHVFTHTETNYQQSFIFEVDRNEINEVEFDDIYVVTSTEHGDIKTKIQFQDLVQQIFQNKGGNLDNEGVEVVVNHLGSLITEEKTQEIFDNINYKDVCDIDPDILIKMSESLEFTDGSTKD